MDKKTTGRRYSAEEKAAAGRMMRTLRAELGTEHGTAQWVALRLGYGVKSVRSWVRQVHIDNGPIDGVASDGSNEIRRLEQENRDLRRANENLKQAGSFLGAKIDREHKMWSSLLSTLLSSVPFLFPNYGVSDRSKTAQLDK